MGNRIGDDPSKPCLLLLERRSLEEAEETCSARGGRLANFQTPEEARTLREFANGHQLGVGLRNTGAEGWKFHGNDTALDDNLLTQFFGPDRDTHWQSRSCARLNRESRSAALEALSAGFCKLKTSWICEGTLENRLTTGVIVKGDLKADEGAFCLWHLPREEDSDYLPNDEEDGFSNTALACRLQTGSSTERQCEFNTSSRSLVTRRGHYSNKQNYPVMGSEVGWSGEKGNETFLTQDDAYDVFHCHFTPENSGLLRMYEFQHMYERNYPGAMKRTCGCGYKFMSNLVSRCDCTRNGVRSNNCATWHQDVLRRATEPHPVRCNNCNTATKL